MSAEENLRRGDLDAALQELQQRVRKEPAASKHRVFLCQLLLVLGQWQRAKTQLDVLRDMDPATLAMVNTYRPALRCELLRAAVFAGRRTPLLFGEPQQWAAEMVQALSFGVAGQGDAAQALRQKALDAAPVVPGRMTVSERRADGSTTTSEHSFAWLADADSRLGPLLEMIVNGKYYWVPVGAVRRLRIDPPQDLRDLVWLPATVEWQNGGEAIALLPARYPGSENAADSALRLCRSTVWQDQGHETFHGSGQKVLATDVGEHGLLDVRAISFGAAG